MIKLFSIISASCFVIYFMFIGLQTKQNELRLEVINWAMSQPEAGYGKQDTAAMDVAFNSDMPPPLSISSLPRVKGITE